MFCPHCGAPVSSGDRFCSLCGTACALVHSGGSTRSFLSPNSPQIAPLTRRLVAAALDFFAAWCLVALVLFLVPKHLLDDGFAGKWPTAAIPFCLCCLGLGYYVGFEALLGATPGKSILAIEVRRLDNQCCDLRSALLRNLLRVVDGFAAYLVGLVVSLLSSTRQRIGDLVAGTVVVRCSPPRFVRVLLLLAWLGFTCGTFAAWKLSR
jgi:uncharacterized RDD family membrane protein YckC